MEASDDLRILIERELKSDERIEWIGSPRPVFFTSESTGIFLFGVPWTAFALFWTAAACRFTVPNFQQWFDVFPFFGLPFLLIGFAMLSAPIWARRRSGQTAYAITNQRAIVVERGWTSMIRSFTADQLQDIYRREKQDGSGDIVFGYDRQIPYNSRTAPREIGFNRIADVQTVERILKEMVQRRNNSDQS